MWPRIDHITKVRDSWYSNRLNEHITVVRYGHFGAPVLLFPTAGGDAEEAERFHLIGVLGPLLDAGRIKVYTCDSVAGRTWIDRRNDGRHCTWIQQKFDEFIYHELVPAIRADCHAPDIEIITAGASIGAFNAFAATCRHPDAFRAAVCMSGTFNLERYLDGHHTEAFHHTSPIHFLPSLGDGPHLHRLRQRFFHIVVGQGRWESPEYSWQAAAVLGSRGIPNRVDMWDGAYDHDWPSWREWLPRYLDSLVD